MLINNFHFSLNQMTKWLFPEYNNVPQKEVESIYFMPVQLLNSFFSPITEETILEFYGFY